MKFILLLACLALYVAHIQCQVHDCRGRPAREDCWGGRNDGQGGGQCSRNWNDMWWYDARTRSCRQMRYLGCGGNNNRYCRHSDCVARCIQGVA